MTGYAWQVPIVVLLALLAIILLSSVVLLPLSLLQRYRVGTRRRPARGWIAAMNVIGFGLSAGMFVIASALANTWIPDAFYYTLIGLSVGCLLGVVGLALTRWEPTAYSLYYTPNRALVLVITLIVCARILYGLWRSRHAWGAGLDSWSAEFGMAGSLAAGAIVLGYYLAYWFGVRRRLKQHRRLQRSS
jgi:hypothetical protein